MKKYIIADARMDEHYQEIRRQGIWMVNKVLYTWI